MKTILSITLLFTLLTSCVKSTDDKFIGMWTYYSSSLTDEKPNDHSLDGNLCEIKKVENTNETYYVTFNNYTFVLTKKDENTLINNNGSLLAMFDESSNHLVLKYVREGMQIEYSKMK
jgi:hypothetical protein